MLIFYQIGQDQFMTGVMGFKLFQRFAVDVHLSAEMEW